MPTIPEPLNGGLVTSRDPSVLNPGELQVADRVMYLPDSDGLWRQPGGAWWDVVSVSAHNVNGLTSCRFDNGSHYLVAQADQRLWSADAETDLSLFTSATMNVTGLNASATRLMSVQFDNRSYLLNGYDLNTVMLQDGTTRPHGLLPSSVPITPSGFATSAFSAPATGWYEYWYTESVIYSDGQELENAYTGQPLSIRVSSLSSAPILQLPSTPANAGRGTDVHYNVYRSEMKSLESDSRYPIGRRLGTAQVKDNTGAAITTAPFFTDSSATLNTGAKVAASNDTAIVRNCAKTYVGAPASDAAALNTDDATYIRITKNTAQSFVDAGVAYLFLHNFSLGTISGHIMGIKIDVLCSSNVANIADIVVCPAQRTGVTTYKPIPGADANNPQLSTNIYSSTFPYAPVTSSRHTKRRTIDQTTLTTTYSFGDADDDFLPSPYVWPVSQFDSSYGVQLAVVFNGKAQNGDYVDIDYVNMTIYYAGTVIGTKPDQKLYDAIVVEEAGVEVKYGANGLPPAASTGCVFEGSLVTNDVAHPSKIVYSVPGRPDYMPTDVYWIDLQSRDNDAITYLGTIGNRLLAGMAGSLHRINYLPNESDASFSRGRAVEEVSMTTGIVNPAAATLFTNGMGQQELAFVDTNGVFATNGYHVRKLSSSLQWVGPSGSSVFPASLGGDIKNLVIALLNDPRTQTLRLVLSNGDMFIGSYAPRHTGPDGSLKWTKGDADFTYDSATITPSASTVFRRDSGSWVVAHAYTSSGINTRAGSVCREDCFEDLNYNPILSGNSPRIKTREISIAGPGSEASITAIAIHGVDRETGTSSKNISASITAVQRGTNVIENVVSTADLPGGTSTSRIAEAGIDGVNAAYVSLDVYPDSTGMFEIQQLLMRGEGFGEEELGA